MPRDKYGRETVGSMAEEFKEDDWDVEVQGSENDPDCVIIRPKKEDEEE